MIRFGICQLLLSGILCCVLVSCAKDETNLGPYASKEIKYNESTDVFSNPERGFMHMYSAKSEGVSLSEVQLRALKLENVTLIQRIYYFEAFKDKPLSAAQLALISADMQKIRDAGLKCVLRFAYTDAMDGTDAPYAILAQHLDQLVPVFEENQDVVAFVQAGLIGPWGEWHHSSNNLTTPDSMKKVLEKLLSVLPADIMVQVRTPHYKQEIFGTAEPVDGSIAYSDDYRTRVGHHNDCFMAGPTDYGTYVNVEADKAYIGKEGLFVPNGGETCPPQADAPDCMEAKETMRMLRWTYLNLDWYKPTVDAWKSSGCFDEFQRNLGYRLVLVSANLPEKATEGENVALNIKITNKGYAPLYNAKITSLVLKNIDSNEVHQFDLPVDIRDCKPNGILTIDSAVKLEGISEGNYKLYLKISDQDERLKSRPEYSVRLANTDTWIPEEGINSLKHELEIVTKP